MPRCLCSSAKHVRSRRAERTRDTDRQSGAADTDRSEERGDELPRVPGSVTPPTVHKARVEDRPSNHWEDQSQPAPDRQAEERKCEQQPDDYFAHHVDCTGGGCPTLAVYDDTAGLLYGEALFCRGRDVVDAAWGADSTARHWLTPFDSS